MVSERVDTVQIKFNSFCALNWYLQNSVIWISQDFISIYFVYNLWFQIDTQRKISICCLTSNHLLAVELSLNYVLCFILTSFKGACYAGEANPWNPSFLFVIYWVFMLLSISLVKAVFQPGAVFKLHQLGWCQTILIDYSWSCGCIKSSIMISNSTQNILFTQYQIQY